MKDELYLDIFKEAPLALRFLPCASAETFGLYPHKPEPASSCEGMRIDGWPPRE